MVVVKIILFVFNYIGICYIGLLQTDMFYFGFIDVHAKISQKLYLSKDYAHAYMRAHKYIS